MSVHSPRDVNLSRNGSRASGGRTVSEDDADVRRQNSARQQREAQRQMNRAQNTRIIFVRGRAPVPADRLPQETGGSGFAIRSLANFPVTTRQFGRTHVAMGPLASSIG
jgi:hypothetical protein